jgi:hypothetical protein
MKEQGNPYIDEKSLQLKGAYVEDGVVEAV